MASRSAENVHRSASRRVWAGSTCRIFPVTARATSRTSGRLPARSLALRRRRPSNRSNPRTCAAWSGSVRKAPCGWTSVIVRRAGGWSICVKSWKPLSQQRPAVEATRATVSLPGALNTECVEYFGDARMLCMSTGVRLVGWTAQISSYSCLLGIRQANSAVSRPWLALFLMLLRKTEIRCKLTSAAALHITSHRRCKP